MKIPRPSTFSKIVCKANKSSSYVVDTESLPNPWEVTFLNCASALFMLLSI